jgi:hypothetical protein
MAPGHSTAPLTGRFPSEPKWVDLTAYRGGADKGDAKFTELAAGFASAIRGMPKEDLLSQEARQQRRGGAVRTTAWAPNLWRGDPGGADPAVGSV